MQSVRDTARELMRGYCRVCPVCNGRVCAGEVPGMGGLGTGAAFQANITALDRKKLVMRLVHDVTAPELSLSLLGLDLSLPVLAAPIGGVAFNMGGKRTEEEYIKAIVDGCVRAGTIGCTGDGVPPEILDSGLAAVTAADGMGIPFIKPWEDEELFRKIDKARQSGARVMGMDIDAAGLVTLRKMGRPVSPKPVSALREVIRRADRPFIIKGVMCVEDAELALEAGAQAIVVSNHGGRVLDQTPGGADVLPEIAARMSGRRRGHVCGKAAHGTAAGHGHDRYGLGAFGFAGHSRGRGVRRVGTPIPPDQARGPDRFAAVRPAGRSFSSEPAASGRAFGGESVLWSACKPGVHRIGQKLGDGHGAHPAGNRRHG